MVFLRFHPETHPFFFTLSALSSFQVLRPTDQHARHYLRRSFFLFILNGFHYLFVENPVYVKDFLIEK
jgi:hypothetical protein